MKRIVILGSGESGMGAAKLAKQKGYAVFISDSGEIHADKKTELTQANIDFEEKGHIVENVLNADLIIKSPGIPNKVAIIQAAKEKGIEIIDELEFAFGYSSGKVIAITGTNGKTTTTSMIYHVMKEAGMDVGLAGNVGKSWAGQLTELDHEWWVIECSSFQIDGMKSFRPKIALLTNITPDHLDRYEYQMDHYVTAKMNLFQNMKEDDFAIFYKEDFYSTIGREQHRIQAGNFDVSIQATGVNAFQSGAKIYFAAQGNSWSMAKAKLPLPGDHNLLNSLFAGLACTLVGLSGASIQKGIMSFQGIEHRMEKVAEIDGVTYVNDSKATNVESAAFALKAYKNPLIWIAGGVDKGNDYSLLLSQVEKQVKSLICLGVDNQKLIAAFGGAVKDIRETQQIEEAVRWGNELGQAGDVVLLSPACASFDLFKNYEDRGRQFAAAVRQLKSERVA
ncbi:UDP-N-acetylmuramoyl-L-alanine--D-glutamate ligase [Algoriphagus namhaensis]|uniref:UDP-N-acetylmuramoylalanine--D-glutamate ligase n=1 Tax=Algoriphagus namhaensis TaxID=915353 RepID=A0ABV8ANX8_9BACT